MRELTIAGGQLRCGECQQVFNANESLSTTMPESYSKLSTKDVVHQHNHQQEQVRDIEQTYTNEVNEKVVTPKLPKETKHASSHTNKILIFTALSLAALLIMQVLYNYRHLFSGEPKREPTKIQMLNHNVFAHPNESGVLLISATMENNAKHAQPYPILEVRLSNAQSDTIALRRFTPEEYLDNPTKGMLLRVKQATSLKLKIKDPGNKATRFQFDFL